MQTELLFCKVTFEKLRQSVIKYKIFKNADNLTLSELNTKNVFSYISVSELVNQLNFVSNTSFWYKTFHTVIIKTPFVLI